MFFQFNETSIVTLLQTLITSASVVVSSYFGFRAALLKAEERCEAESAQAYRQGYQEGLRKYWRDSGAIGEGE